MSRMVGNLKRRAGSAMLIALVFTVILSATIVGLVQLSSHRLKMQYDRWDWHEAYYHAENGLNWVSQVIADADEGGNTAAFLGHYYGPGEPTEDSDFQAAIPYAGNLENAHLEDMWITVENHPNGIHNMYLVTCSAKVGDKIRTLQSEVQKDPPSRVFDYEYFLNNWGWWWGSSITGYGDNRANWDFDFRYDPRVNGHVLAGGNIEEDSTPVDPFSGEAPFRGLAGDDPLTYVHSGVPRLTMPNLLDLSYYEDKAVDEGGTIVQDGNVLVNAIQDDATQPGLYLKGTDSKPIEINGPVVVPGDVVISGKITGQGTLYVGGSLYVAGDMTYSNPPDFSTAPAMMNNEDRDDWVQEANEGDKDLISFAVRESVFAGEVNSSEWKSRCFNPSGYGLKYVGDERNLGADGIAHTPDDGQDYLDTNGDGVADSAWYDADEDGTVDLAYNYDNDIKMTTSRARDILNYPLQADGVTPKNFNDLSTNSMNKVDGVIYTNHAAAMRLGSSNAVMHGALILRDEAIIFTSTLKFYYDPRIHSRYSNDPNRYIDLGLPIAERVRLETFAEITPVEGYYDAG